MIIFVDVRMIPRQQRGGRRRGIREVPMTQTPTNGSTCFPFAVNCRLTKTFFGVPRKCSHCQKMIVLTAGFACQFCRYRCHKKCMGEEPHPCSSRRKLCSLSRLPSGDEELFAKLLRENEINCNEVDVFPEDWASVLSRAAPRIQRDAYCHTDSFDTSTSEAQSPVSLEPPESFCEVIPEQEETVIDRFLRLLPWNRGQDTPESSMSRPGSLCVPRPSSGACSSNGAGPSSPVKTPVDDFNNELLEEMFLRRSVSSATSTVGPLNASCAGPTKLINRRLNWVRHIAGERAAHSQDCVIDSNLFSPTRLQVSPDFPRSSESAVDGAEITKLSATWPLSGLHINHENNEDEDDSSAYSSALPSDCYRTREDSISTEENRKSLLEVGEWSVPNIDIQYGECVVEGRRVDTFRGKWHGDVMIHKYQSEDLDQFLQDVHTLTKIRHENIALFMGACMESPDLAIITSIRKGDSLFDTVHVKDRRLSHQSKVNIAKQIAQGMGYLHAKGIILKCLTSKSVYLESKVKICMVDYGGPSIRSSTSAAQMAEMGAAYRGHLTYLSPELMASLRVAPPSISCDGEYSKESDVYAFGTVLYEMFAGEFPLSNLPAEAVIWLIGSGQRQDVDKLSCHVAMKSLIEDCWSPDPSYRPSFTDILRDLYQTAALNKKHSSSEPERLHRAGLYRNSFQLPQP